MNDHISAAIDDAVLKEKFDSMLVLLGETLFAIYIMGAYGREEVDAFSNPVFENYVLLWEQSARLDLLYDAYWLFMGEEKSVFRSWMLGCNPWVGDRTPLEAIRDMDSERVLDAVVAYNTSAWS